MSDHVPRGSSTSAGTSGQLAGTSILKTGWRSIGDVIELTRQRGANHRARMCDLHAAADAVRSAGPAGVHEPHARAVLGDALAELLRVDVRIERQEWRAETRAEGRARFGHALLGAGHLRGVAREVVIHRALRRQTRDRRQYAIGIGRQHHDVLRMAAGARRHRIVDELDRVRGARVLGEGRIVEIQQARHRIHHDVLEDRAESPRRRVNLRFGFSREPNGLRVAAAFEVEDASIAPAMLIVADELPIRIARERRLAGARESEEERSVAGLADIGRAVHRQHVLQAAAGN